METQELLQQFEAEAMLLQNLENSPAYQEWKAQAKKVEDVKDQIKARIRAGEEITGSEKYEIKKSFTTVYDVNKFFYLVWDETALLYAGDPVIEYPNFDKKKFEKDLKDGVLPETVADIKWQWNFKINFTERKQTDFEL